MIETLQEMEVRKKTTLTHKDRGGVVKVDSLWHSIFFNTPL